MVKRGYFFTPLLLFPLACQSPSSLSGGLSGGLSGEHAETKVRSESPNGSPRLDASTDSRPPNSVSKDAEIREDDVEPVQEAEAIAAYSPNSEPKAKKVRKKRRSQPSAAPARSRTNHALGSMAVEGDVGPQHPYDREGYDDVTENSWQEVSHAPLSTFSIDVDTGFLCQSAATDRGWHCSTQGGRARRGNA